MGASQKLPFMLGDWRIDPQADVISRADSSVKLVPKTMEVLGYLVQRAGEVVSQEDIEAAVWRDLVVTPSSVYQAIGDLRRALGDDKREPQYIATIPRKGYRLIAPVRSTGDDADRSATQANPADAGPAQWTTRRKALLIAAPIAAAVVVIATTLTWMHRDAAPASGAEAQAPSIAVLPIADFSDDGGESHFADGLTEELLNALAQVPGLRVTARTSSFAFKNRDEDVRAIGKTLGARYLLEGSVRRGNGRLRVVAQLIDTQDGYHLWSKTFDRAVGDVLSVQEEVSQAVAESLKLTLSGRSLLHIKARQPASVEAHELYLLGRHYQLQRNPDAIAKAISYHEQAIAADPRFALAYAGLADAHMATYYYSNAELARLATIIEPLVTKGLALNPDLPELHAARAVLRTEQWRLDDAERDLRRAIELNPSLGDAYVRLGAAYEYDGRPRDGLDAYTRATELDPLHYVLHVRRCLTLQNLGRYEDAGAACDSAVRLQPDLPNAHWARGLLALSRGDMQQAVVGYRAALERAPSRVDLLEQLGSVYLDMGLLDEAAQTLDRAAAIVGALPNPAALARGRKFIAADDLNGLRGLLDDRALHTAASSDLLLQLALLELTAGRTDAAQQYAQRAANAANYAYPRLMEVWDTRWGHSGVMTLALLARAAGDGGAAAQHLATLAAYLDTLERNGHVWFGLHYLRAEIFAQQGRTERALTELERAAALGWRSTWWARHDPAFAPLRNVEGFAAVLESVDRSNEAMRAKYLSSAAAAPSS